MFCRSIVRWRDERMLSVKQIYSLLYARRGAARSALARERRIHRYMITVMPANTLPL